MGADAGTGRKRSQDEPVEDGIKRRRSEDPMCPPATLRVLVRNAVSTLLSAAFRCSCFLCFSGRRRNHWKGKELVIHSGRNDNKMALPSRREVITSSA